LETEKILHGLEGTGPLKLNTSKNWLLKGGELSCIPLIASREYAWLFFEESFLERIFIMSAVFVSASAAVERGVDERAGPPTGSGAYP